MITTKINTIVEALTAITQMKRIMTTVICWRKSTLRDIRDIHTEPKKMTRSPRSSDFMFDLFNIRRRRNTRNSWHNSTLDLATALLSYLMSPLNLDNLLETADHLTLTNIPMPHQNENSKELLKNQRDYLPIRLEWPTANSSTFKLEISLPRITIFSSDSTRPSSQRHCLPMSFQNSLFVSWIGRASDAPSVWTTWRSASP